MNFNFKKLVPHIVAVLVFVVVSCLFFQPLLGGKQLKQSDITHFKEMSKEIVDHRNEYGEEPLWTNAMFSGMPAYQISVVYSNNLLRYIDQASHIGLPRPIAYMMMMMLGFYILLQCLKVNPYASIGLSVIAGLGTITILYLGAGHMSKIRSISFMAPFIGGLIYTFRSHWLKGSAIAAFFLGMQIYSNHLQMTYYLLYLAVLISLFEIVRLLKEKKSADLTKIIGGLMIACLLGLLPNLNNIYSTYNYAQYTMRGDSKITVQPEGQLGQEKNSSGLNKDYITEYSLGSGEVFSIFVPDIKGGDSKGSMANSEIAMEAVSPQFAQYMKNVSKYWGEQRFTGGSIYFGVILLTMFLIGMFVVKDTIKWPLLIFGVLALMLSLKYGALTNFFIDSVPFFSKFRDTKMILTGVPIIMVILSGILIKDLMDGKVEKESEKLLIGGSGLVLCISLLFAFAPGSLLDMVSMEEKRTFAEMIAKPGQEGAGFLQFTHEINKGREAIVSADALRSLGFVFLTCVAIFLLYKKITNSIAIVVSLSLIGLVDIWGVSKRYLNEDLDRNGNMISYEEKEGKSINTTLYNADVEILKKEMQLNPELKELISQKIKEYKQEKGINKVGNYEQAQIGLSVLRQHSNYRVAPVQSTFVNTRASYFHKSIGGYHAMKLGAYQDLIDFRLQSEISNVLEELQSGRFTDSSFEKQAVLNMLNTKYVLTGQNNPAVENTSRLGNAWFVSNTRSFGSDNELIKVIESGNFQPRKEALVLASNEAMLQGISNNPVNPNELIEMTSYKANEISYSSSSNEDRLAVFSEIYFPEGWSLTIDDQESEIIEVNYLLRGAKIPKGDHKITMSFKPEIYHQFSALSLFSSIALIFSCIYIGFFGAKKEGF